MLTTKELKFKIEWYKKLKAKIEKILCAEMTIEQYNNDIYNKIKKLEEELNALENNDLS